MDEFWVNFYGHDEHGAPAYGTSPGDLIKLLNATLVTGFGTIAIDAVEPQAGGKYRVRFTSAKTFRPVSVIELSGLTPSILNGKYRVETSAPGYVEIAMSGAPSSIVGATIKKPPVGTWVYENVDGLGTKGRFDCKYHNNITPSILVTDTAIENAKTSAKGAFVEGFYNRNGNVNSFYSGYWQKRHSNNTRSDYTVVVEKRGFYVFHNMYESFPSCTFFGYLNDPYSSQIPVVLLNATNDQLTSNYSRIGNYPRIFGDKVFIRASGSRLSGQSVGVKSLAGASAVSIASSFYSIVFIPRLLINVDILEGMMPGAMLSASKMPQGSIVGDYILIPAFVSDGQPENSAYMPLDSWVSTVAIKVCGKWNI